MITDVQIENICKSRDFLHYTKEQVNVVQGKFVLITIKTPNYLKNSLDPESFKKIVNHELIWWNANRGKQFELLKIKEKSRWATI